MPLIEEIPEGGEEEAEEAAAEREARWKKEEEEEALRVQGQFDLAEACRAEGSTLFSDGKLQEARDKYLEAIRELYRVGNEPENRVKAEKANLVLHLNLSLVSLKLEDFEAAKDHATSAWGIDQENVKALYRRALAQAALARKSTLFQEAEAKAACNDFMALLRIEPNNADARRELQKLRAEIRAHEEESLQKQKETWGQVFGGKAEGEDIPDKPLPPVRPVVDSERHCWVSAQNVAVGGGRDGPVLSDVDLNLPEKWCVGILAQENAEKAALVNVLTRKVRPSAGKFEYPKKAKRGVNPKEVFHVTTPIMMATMVGASAVSWALFQNILDWAIAFMAGVFMVLTVPLILYLWYEQQVEKRPPVILHMTPQGCKHWKPSGGTPVLQVLGQCLPKKIEKKDRDSRASALLRAAGMKLEDIGLFRDLTEDQKQLVYILRCLVVKAKVIIVDNALRDLEPASQSRMLRMLKRMKQDCNQSILFLSSDLQQLSLVCDSLGMLSKGKLCELGPADEVLAYPRHPDMKEAIATSNIRDMDTSLVKGSSLAEFYNDLLQDSALGAMWLPKDPQ